MMQKITEIDVDAMANEINHDMWETLTNREGYYKNWEGSDVQHLIRHVNTFTSGGLEEVYAPCTTATPLDDMCLPGFCPTNLLSRYPETMKTLVWFVNTYGGKYARAHYYRTPAGCGTKIHIDAQPDKFVPKETIMKAVPYGDLGGDAKKALFYYQKERFHIIIDGTFEYTVDYDEEDRLYEYPITSMVSPVTKVWSKGEVWWFNNKRPHTSYNHGNIPKINLIFDIEGAVDVRRI